MRQPVTPVPGLVLRQQRIAALLERAKPGQQLDRAMVIEGAFRRPDRLARQPQIPRNCLDCLTVRVLAPDPNDCLHHQHPEPATWKTRQPATPSE